MRELIFSGIEYRDNIGYLLLDTLDEDEPSRIRLEAKNTSFFLSQWKDRYCIGRYDLETLKSWPCPHQTTLGDHIKGNLCNDCNKFNNFNPFFYNLPLSDLSEKQQKWNMSPHIVYLAYFGDNVIKVWISHHKRYFTRWLEQWARAASIIYQCKNAYDARTIEANISNMIKLPEVLRSAKKRQLIIDRFDREKCLTTFQSIKESINQLPHNFTLIDWPVEFLDDYQIWNHNISKNTIDLNKDWSLEISGNTFWLIGDNLLFTNDNQEFIFGLKNRVSYTVLFDQQIHKQAFAPKQSSLF